MRSTFVTGTAGLAKQIGTPHFMSPEAFSKSAVDHRTDIWSVGVTFYYLLTGKLPFDKPSEMAADGEDDDEELSEMEVYHNVRTIDPFETGGEDLLKEAHEKTGEDEPVWITSAFFLGFLLPVVLERFS